MASGTTRTSHQRQPITRPGRSSAVASATNDLLSLPQTSDKAAIRSELSGSAASALGRRGVAPVLALDRRSIAAGFNPATPLEVRRNNNLCIRVRSVGGNHTSAGGRQWLTFSPS